MKPHRKELQVEIDALIERLRTKSLWPRDELIEILRLMRKLLLLV